MNVFRTTARIAVRVVLLARISPTRSSRPFSCTPIYRASEDAESFMAAFKNSPLFTQFAEKPEALVALSKVAEFLRKNEFDMSIPLSSMTMFKLATSAEFRELARNAMLELRKAGIDIKPENAVELFSQASGQPKGPR